MDRKGGLTILIQGKFVTNQSQEWKLSPKEIVQRKKNEV